MQQICGKILRHFNKLEIQPDFNVMEKWKSQKIVKNPEVYSLYNLQWKSIFAGTNFK